MARHRNPQISFLVPFRPDDSSPHRTRVWRWLREYWSWELPDAEIVIGRSSGKAFSKTEAVNDAAKRARGRTFVILDSDTYIRGSIIRHCANEIDEAIRKGHRLWFIPYRHLYRLNEETTERVLNSNPRHPLRFTSPPDDDEVLSTQGSSHGHRFGAMIQIMPREAFEHVGCMDPRFKGWGGEDIAFVRAVDTLYGKHKTTENDVVHLWHASVDVTPTIRMWQGQKSPGHNNNLAARYNQATGDRARMRRLVDEGCRSGQRRWWWSWSWKSGWAPWSWFIVGGFVVAAAVTTRLLG
jgi:hypothetical protein